MAGVTFTPTDGQFATFVLGNRRCAMGTVDFDDSYPTGGEAITAGLFGLAHIDAVFVSGVSLAGRFVTWDATNSKLKAYDAGTTEEGNETDMSADAVVVLVIGT